MSKKITFVDLNESFIRDVSKEFNSINNVDFKVGNIFDIPFVDLYVTAGNSFGIMTGGIDLAFRNKFGVALQDKIQEEIFFYRKLENGLPVGNAISVNIPGTDKVCIYAPTMEIPMNISNTNNVYKAFSAILREIVNIRRSMSYKGITTHIACPGLGTLSGKVPTNVAAKQMRDAFRDIFEL